jgi:hypothetical protein
VDREKTSPYYHSPYILTPACMLWQTTLIHSCLGRPLLGKERTRKWSRFVHCKRNLGKKLINLEMIRNRKKFSAHSLCKAGYFCVICNKWGLSEQSYISLHANFITTQLTISTISWSTTIRTFCSGGNRTIMSGLFFVLVRTNYTIT